MRILVTCSRYPASLQDGLALRVLHYVRHLRDRHHFDLVCLESPDIHLSSAPEMEALFGQVICVPYEKPGAYKGWKRFSSAFDPTEHYPRSPAAIQAISNLLARHRYDLIWDAGANMMNNLNEARAWIPLLADQVDDSFIRLRREIADARGLTQRLRLRKQLLLEQQFAKRFLTPAEAVLFVSSVDEASFKAACPSAHTVTIANGVDAEFFGPDTETDRRAGRLVFEGSMEFDPNIDAMLHFVRGPFRHIQERRRDASLSIVGRNPTASIQALASPSIEVTGTVPDIRPWMRQAEIFVCPMRRGAGIKNKILQAWAMGLPVVSTAAGAQGLVAVDGSNIVIRNSETEFADAVLELLADEELARRIGEAGRKTVLSQYSWRSKGDELNTLFDAIANGR